MWEGYSGSKNSMSKIKKLCNSLVHECMHV